MAAPSQGSQEIEQTLRVARDSVERDIARYRLRVFAVVLVTTFFVGGLLEGTFVPASCFFVAVVYAAALNAFLARRGNRGWIAVVSLLCDLGITGITFVLAAGLGDVTIRAQSVPFASAVAAPGLLLVLLINSLRYSRASAVAGAVAAPVVYVATVVPLVGPHRSQIAVLSIVIMAGLVGIAAASQARKNLDSFARLHLLRRYLPPAAVERVLREEPDAALSLGGRLVTVTLLAADLRGFTAMSEKLAPTDVMAQLNAYHGAMIDVIDRHGGAIDKFIGDGTLVVFGLVDGRTVEQAAEAGVGCAGAMLEALALHNQERVRAGIPALAMGIGVHTGPVIAGNLGVPGRRLEFTVIGDTVNTVARLEGETKALGTPVVVSAATAERLARSSDVLRELAPVSIRGKEHAMRVFTLASLGAPPR